MSWNLRERLGGFGPLEAHLARRDGADVVVKLLRGHGAEAQAFLDTARGSRRPMGARAVPVIEAGATDDRVFAVVPFVRGVDLAQLSTLGAQAPLDVGVVCTIGAEVALGLVLASPDGLTPHGSLTPGNVRITPTGQVRVLDFQLAERSGVSAQDPARARYRAPERVRGAPPSIAADLWSLGLLLFELATGGLGPEAGADPGAALIALRGDGTDDGPLAHLAAVVTTLLDPEPTKRGSPAAAAARLTGSTRAAPSWAWLVAEARRFEAAPSTPPAPVLARPPSPPREALPPPSSPPPWPPSPEPPTPSVAPSLPPEDAPSPPERSQAAVGDDDGLAVHDGSRPLAFDESAPAAPAQPPELVARLGLDPPPHRRRAAVAAALGLVLAGGAGVALWRAHASKPTPAPTPPRPRVTTAGGVDAVRMPAGWKPPLPSAAPQRAAPKPPSKPVPGRIFFDTIPSGATAWIDGVQRGLTPVDFGIGGGRHQVAFVKQGFAVYRRAVDSGPGFVGIQKLIPAELPPRGDASLKVRCASDGLCPVYVDGEATGLLCPTDRISLPSGRHEIAIFAPKRDRFFTQTRDVPPTDSSTRVSFPY